MWRLRSEFSRFARASIARTPNVSGLSFGGCITPGRSYDPQGEQILVQRWNFRHRSKVSFARTTSRGRSSRVSRPLHHRTERTWFASSRRPGCGCTRFSAGGVADEWVTQLLRQGDAQVFKKYSQMKLQMKREALQKMNRQANEVGRGFDTAMTM